MHVHFECIRGRFACRMHSCALRIRSISLQRLKDPDETLDLCVLVIRAAHLESQHLDGGRLDIAVSAALSRVRLARRVVHRLDVCHCLTCGCNEQSDHGLVLRLIFLLLGVRVRDLLRAVYVAE